MKKNCKFFVVQNGSLAVSGMPDIDTLGLISLNYDTAHRKVAADDSIDKSENPIQTEGGNVSSLKATSRMQKHKANRMQTIHLSWLLSLIQQSWVTITMTMI